MSVIKTIEIIAASENGFDEAVRNAVKEASKSVNNIQSVYVKEMNAKVEDNAVVSYGINAKISFEIA
jgi:flavin-binding protein dodecin